MQFHVYISSVEPDLFQRRSCLKVDFDMNVKGSLWKIENIALRNVIIIVRNFAFCKPLRRLLSFKEIPDQGHCCDKSSSLWHFINAFINVFHRCK